VGVGVRGTSSALGEKVSRRGEKLAEGAAVGDPVLVFWVGDSTELRGVEAGGIVVGGTGWPRQAVRNSTASMMIDQEGFRRISIYRLAK